MNKTDRKSILAPYINGLLEEKHASGYAYGSEEKVLDRFDGYCIEKGLDSLTVTKEFLSGWMEQTDQEGAFNQGKRISCVRQLMLFMGACGVHVYVPHGFCHFKRALPHIFDQTELVAFFRALDGNQPPKKELTAFRLHMEYRLIFRTYLCCGMRNNEVAGIASEHVDLEKGVLTVINAKGQKDRTVCLPEDLLESYRKYSRWLHEGLKIGSGWFFPGRSLEKPVPNTTIDSVFGRIWCRTPYAGCSNKPTVHDFRFTFVVNRMNLWAEQGLDLKAMMPYLSRFLGHKTTDATFYYYFLVRDAYKTDAKKDTFACAVIPEVRDYEQ